MNVKLFFILQIPRTISGLIIFLIMSNIVMFNCPEKDTGMLTSRKKVWYYSLAEIDTALRQRLITVIREKYEYFLLTGTDPADPLGCCPSSEVASARLLVEAGILQCAERMSTPGACPSAVYAFADEISGTDNNLCFTCNEILRSRVWSRLAGSRHRWTSRVRIFLLILLSFFLVTALGTALFQTLQSRNTGHDTVITTGRLGVKAGSYILVTLFHYTERCAFCLKMEELTRKTLDTYFTGELAGGDIVFTDLPMDTRAYSNLKEQLGLFTSTVILFEIRGRNAVRWERVEEAWGLTDKEPEFITMMRDELRSFRTAVQGDAP